MSVQPLRRILDQQMSESQFQAEVIKCAELRGWLVMHIHDSRRSHGEGYPDLTMVRDGRVIWAELKAQRGRLSRDQQKWRDALWAADDRNNHVSYYEWRPADWDDLVAELW